MGALLPPDARLADDPYGAAFTGAATERALRFFAARPALGWAALRAIGPLLTSALYLQVRTRVLDDVLRAFARAGGGQVVLLGAGYDCRALRLGGALGGRVTFFEVDHPATQGHKRRVLAGLDGGGADGGGAPVRYLPWDFEARPLEALPAELAAHGHDRGAPTLTILEGVTMYLTAQAVEATVAAVRAYSGPGSELAVSYFDRPLVERPGSARQGGWLVALMVSRVGEPFRFGWSPTELPPWLAARGFGLRWDHDLGDCARELLPPRLAARVPVHGRRCALAPVAAGAA
jgi:methyltransferase (TIGR00027 family)